MGQKCKLWRPQEFAYLRGPAPKKRLMISG